MGKGSDGNRGSMLHVDVVRWTIDQYDSLSRLAEGDAMRYIEFCRPMLDGCIRWPRARFFPG